MITLGIKIYQMQKEKEEKNILKIITIKEENY